MKAYLSMRLKTRHEGGPFIKLFSDKYKANRLILIIVHILMLIYPFLYKSIHGKF